VPSSTSTGRSGAIGTKKKATSGFGVAVRFVTSARGRRGKPPYPSEGVPSYMLKKRGKTEHGYLSETS